MPLGAQVSIAGGVDKALLRGWKLGCETIQIFTKNSRQWQARPLAKGEIERFHLEREKTGIAPIIAHDSYLINLASPKEDLWRKSVAALVEELARCQVLGIPYLVAHPGSHRGAGERAGLQRIAEALEEIRARTEGLQVQVLLENTAGQGTSLGCRFEHLARLMESDRRLGVCFDTCHAFAAGYELRTREGYEETFQELDELVGLHRLRVIHLNDSKGDLGGRVDRHEHIGQGHLGLKPFRMLMNEERFRHLPMILETPKEQGMDVENLAVLRSLIGG